MTCMLLAVLYWNKEQDFDTFHAKASQIYRITTTLKERADGPTFMQGGTGQVQNPAFKAAVPELLDYVRILGGDVYADVRHEQTTHLNYRCYLRTVIFFLKSLVFHW